LLHFPNAKINLGLFVTQKRPDGYHDIETVFYPLPMLKDALEVLPAIEENPSAMRVSGKKIEGDVYDNLVWKAFQLLQAGFPDKVSEVQIHLMKTIPMGAGLGGGSADGAFMLRLLNKFFNLELSDETLSDFALQLGSDCPFFIYNTPHFAKGRGEILTPVELDLSSYSIQVVCPKVHISTAAAFSNITPKPSTFDLSKLGSLPVEDWRDFVLNDFEYPVFKTNPELSVIKEKLYASGALYASMSGSGSTIYGIFKEGEKSGLITDSGHEVFYFE
jgi:4-diphosphocytidyl-2-C-methyl-D-erythritol kinase